MTKMQRMTDYLLRDVPKSVWAAFGARVKREGQSRRSALLALIRYYIRFGPPRDADGDQKPT